MHHRLLHEDNGHRTYVAVLETGDEVMICLQAIAAAEHIFAAQLTAIGALSDVVLLYFDWPNKAGFVTKVKYGNG